MMQGENRFLDFANDIMARHRGLGLGFEPASMIHLEDQQQEPFEPTAFNQSYTTNLYHIQNIKEENYLFKQNLSFLTQVLENSIYKNLYPSVEKQIEKVIREEMPESEAKIIQSVSEQLVCLVQQGGIQQYEILKEKVLSEYNETSNTKWMKQETLLRKIENIWNSSVYHRYETKKEEHTEQNVHVANHYTALSQNGKVTANLQFPTQERLEKHDSSSVEMIPQTITEIKTGNESSSVVTKEVLLKQLLNQIISQRDILHSVKQKGIGNYGAYAPVSLSIIQNTPLKKELLVSEQNVNQITKQIPFVTPLKVIPSHESISLEYVQETQNSEVEVQHSLQVQTEVQKQVGLYTRRELQKQVEQHTQAEVQNQVEQSAQIEIQKIQKTTVKHTPEFYERTREQQEQIANYKEAEKPKVSRLESVSLEYMQEESAKETADAQLQRELQKQIKQHTQVELQKQVDRHIQTEVRNQVEQSVQIETQKIQDTTVKYTPEFYERTREQQEQIVNYKEAEKPKVSRLESISLEYMQEESTQETAHVQLQREVQKQVEQHTQKEVQKQVEQHTQTEVQKQVEKSAQIEKQKIQETTVKHIPEFYEKTKKLQEQIVHYQEIEKQKTAGIESISLEYMQEESVQETSDVPLQSEAQKQLEIGRQTIAKYVSYENQFRKNLQNKNTFVQSLLQGNSKEVFRSVIAEPLSLEYPTEENEQLHQQMIQMVQSEIQSIPQVPQVVSSKDVVEQKQIEHRTQMLERTKNVSEQMLLRMENLGLVPITQIKTATKTVASYQLSKVLLEHMDAEMTTEELQESLIRILQNYRTETIKQTSVSKAFSPIVKMTKLQSKVPGFVQQREPASVYYRSEEQIFQEQQEKHKNLEQKVQEVVKNLKTIEEKTIVHKEKIIEQQKEVVHEVLKNHSKDLFMDKESTTFIRGEVQQSIEEQMNQNVGKIADKVYRQLENKLKSERGRRGLI